MKLKDVMLQHIAKTLAENNGNRAKTAKDLGISVRGLRNYLPLLKAKGFETYDHEIEESVFPTNSQRLKHLDWQSSTTGVRRKGEEHKDKTYKKVKDGN